MSAIIFHHYVIILEKMEINICHNFITKVITLISIREKLNRYFDAQQELYSTYLYCLISLHISKAVLLDLFALYTAKHTNLEI